MIGFGSVFDITVFLIHIGYIALAIGILREEPLILSVIDYWIKVFVGLFLLYRFNPYVHIKFTEFDRKVIFSAGLFMIITTVVNTYLINYEILIPNDEEEGYNRQMMAEENERQMEAEQGK